MDALNISNFLETFVIVHNRANIPRINTCLVTLSYGGDMETGGPSVAMAGPAALQQQDQQFSTAEL